MKWNIYSKLWVIFFVLMGAACTNQVEDAIPVSGQPIEFSVQSDWKEIPNTRLNDGKTHFKDSDSIQIFGFHRSSNVEKKFMYRVNDSVRGQIVEYHGGNWIYSPKRFWPKEGKLDFYAGYPHYSVLNDEKNHRMTYEQTVNPLQLDLLWGVSNNHDCAKDSIKNVVINMKHALAKVIIHFDESSLGNIKQAVVSAYQKGYFSQTDSLGIPIWNVDTTSFQKATLLPFDKQQTIGDATVFILPDRIKELILTTLDGEEIDASDKIKNLNLKFKAGKLYDLKISQKKNTKTRSIAMSVRCVSK
mgnify:FL=1